MEATLLVELLTEELPPKSLRTLSDGFAAALFADLHKSGFLLDGSGMTAYATPRRLAVSVSRVLPRSPDQAREVQGPSIAAPPAAVAGFAKKNGVEVGQLAQADTPKGKVFVARVTAAGAALDTALAAKVAEALKRLPIPKLMRWGSGEAQFVRPAHGLVMLHGSQVVPGSVLVLESGNRTRGHRFMGRIDIVLKNADEYESRLLKDGMVVAQFAQRRAMIETALAEEAARQGAGLGTHDDLLDEVTALVEHPSVYAGAFDPVFLDVPQECLILTMRKNQKYFPLFGTDGRLLPKFLIVSNMRLEDPRHIVDGNQRVVRPRLQDARFFYDQDRRERLETRVPRLARVVYHNKLGSQLDRVLRVQEIAGGIAARLGADRALAERGAWLAKADLLTGMVGEFPELQGVMGRYYALHDGEPAEVADAVEAHYRPRFAGDRLPEDRISASVALADKLETLFGIFGIGGAPTGDKDPFALRRHALGVLRILIELKLPLPLNVLLPEAVGAFSHARPSGWKGMPAEVHGFLLDRLRGYLRELGYAQDEIEAVVSPLPERMDLVPVQLDAVREFRKLPEAASLAAANKRIRNILKQAPPSGDAGAAREWENPAEAALFDAMQSIGPRVARHFGELRYKEALIELAALKTPVDNFFDDVKVMVDDPEVRNSRLGLLRTLDGLMNQVADLSKLAA